MHQSTLPLPSTESVSRVVVSRGTKAWRLFWMITSTIAIVAVVIFLVNPPKMGTQTTHAAAKPVATEPPAAVRVVGNSLIAISTETPLREQLKFETTKKRRVDFPTMIVTGSVMARVRDGQGSLEDRWQFATPELSTTYADWVRAKSEVEFATSQYQKTKELVKAENEHLEAVVKRLKPLNDDAVVAASQFKQAQADLLKSQLQGEKDVFAAQSTLRTSQKTLAALERSLSQTGLDPIVFGRANDNMALVVANVPENRISDVREQQACEATFYGNQGTVFHGHVESLGSAVTPDRRTLRVLFDINDIGDLLKPGMYGEVGLGTDERDAILVPPDSLLHIGRNDYVLAQLGAPGTYQVAEVKLGELHDGRFEVLDGLDAGSEIVSEGAILLKPLAVEALAYRGGPSTP